MAAREKVEDDFEWGQYRLRHHPRWDHALLGLMDARDRDASQPSAERDVRKLATCGRWHPQHVRSPKYYGLCRLLGRYFEWHKRHSQCWGRLESDFSGKHTCLWYHAVRYAALLGCQGSQRLLSR